MISFISVPNDLIVIKREYFNRWYSLKAYFLSAALGDTPIQVKKISKILNCIDIRSGKEQVSSCFYTGHQCCSFYSLHVCIIRATLAVVQNVPISSNYRSNSVTIPRLRYISRDFAEHTGILTRSLSTILVICYEY